VENMHLLESFLNLAGKSLLSFRYYNSRPISIIRNHHCTFLFINSNNNPVAYGHLDNDNGITWLGIAVAENHIGLGYGKKMMNALIDEAKKNRVKEIYLTVDKDNIIAIELYEKCNFIRVEEKEYFKYKLSFQ
jgi:ribosomal protein S18 acetylase RimI-like enzyme